MPLIDKTSSIIPMEIEKEAKDPMILTDNLETPKNFNWEYENPMHFINGKPS